jgi:hypothetical protein
LKHCDKFWVARNSVVRRSSYRPTRRHDLTAPVIRRAVDLLLCEKSGLGGELDLRVLGGLRGERLPSPR